MDVAKSLPALIQLRQLLETRLVLRTLFKIDRIAVSPEAWKRAEDDWMKTAKRERLKADYVDAQRSLKDSGFLAPASWLMVPDAIRCTGPDADQMIANLDAMAVEIERLRAGTSGLAGVTDPQQAAGEGPETLTADTVVARAAGPAELFARIEGAVLDSNAADIIRTLSDKSIGREDRARRVCRIDPRYWNKPAPFWAEHLECTDAAVRQWTFWKVERKNHVGGE